MELPQQIQDKLAQFQNIQNQLQSITMQRVQLSQQLIDIDNALSELKKVEKGKIYEKVGAILVEVSKDEIENKLKDEKEVKEARLKSIEKQESKLREKLNELGADLQSQLKGIGG